MTTPEISSDDLARKEAELREQRRRAMPLAVLVGILGVLTAMSAAGNALFGVDGIHMLTAPILVVLILVRLPQNLRSAALMREVEALRKTKSAG
jgi:hypothetical protein